MATFNPGTGATLKSTTLEAAFLEIYALVMNATRLTTAPENAIVGYQIDGATSTLQGNFALPFESALTAGLLTQNPVPFVDESGYTTGAGGDLASTGLIDNLVELAYKVNEAPADTTVPVPGGLDLTINMDEKLISGDFTLPVTLSVNTDGSVKYEANPFLL